MRGKVAWLFGGWDASRITPAYAGKRQSGLPETAGCQDHPRLCGEKVVVPDMQKTLSGSPPPMRGKVQI